MHNLRTIHHLNKVYDNQTIALRNICTTFPSGKLVGLIGRNGAGKSTFLHVLSGVVRPTSGWVAIDLTARNQLAWVSQMTSLDWYLNVLDNVRLGARLGGASIQESFKWADPYIELLQLKEVKHQSVELLSGGQQRSVQITRAMAQCAQLLLLDEPTLGTNALNLMDSLKQMTREGKTIVVSSHDLSLLQSYIDHVWFFNQGSLEIDLSIDQFLHHKGTHTHQVLSIEYNGTLSVDFLDVLRGENIQWEHKTDSHIKLSCPIEMETNVVIAKFLAQVDLIAVRPAVRALKNVYD